MVKPGPGEGKTGMEAGLVVGRDTATPNQSPGKSHKKYEMMSKAKYTTVATARFHIN